jgi:hypothetical protein
MKVIDSIPVEIDYEELSHSREFRGLRSKEKQIEALVEKSRDLIKPRAVFTFLKVNRIDGDLVQLEGDHVLRSSLLSNVLKCGQTVAPYVITIGRELEREASRTSDRDVFDAWVLGRIGDHALGKASLHVGSLISRELGESLSSFAPGAGTGRLFGLEQQAVLFQILDPLNNIAVSITPSYLMIPIKSISGVFAKAGEDYVACQYCPRECGSRRRPFSGEYQDVECKGGDGGAAINSDHVTQ